MFSETDVIIPQPCDHIDDPLVKLIATIWLCGVHSRMYINSLRPSLIIYMFFALFACE